MRTIPMRMPARHVVATVLGAALLLTGCSSKAASPDADSPAFAGLDVNVVAEVLENPTAVERIKGEPDDTQDSMAQGIARNFIVCRNALDVYQTWIDTGVRPDLAPLPMPDNPVDPSARLWESDYASLEARAESGDPANLRDWLTLEGSCGAWIPANPGDPNGPTIADVVESSS